MTVLDKQKLYRMPWSLYDNPIGWIEITDKCNMDCIGCYRNYIETKEGHKSLKNIKKEILYMKNVRNVSEITLAGGEPLLHPEIFDIVEFISSQHFGAKIFTNGKGLTLDFLKKLVSSGLTQITFHIDSLQTRNEEWDNKNEIELNELRQYYVRICQVFKDLDFSFASMVTHKTLKYVPNIIRWALENKGKVKAMAFFALRHYKTAIDKSKPTLVSINSKENVHSADIYDVIKKDFPNYEVAAYFGGTRDHKSFKWLFAVSFCSSNNLMGSLSPISIELYQVLLHLKYGRYLGNEPSEGLYEKYLIKLLCLIFDRKIHRVLYNLLKSPKLFFDSLYLFRIIIVQAHDIFSGDMDMCDGCPDMTYFRGRLVNSCRLDEFRKYGKLIDNFKEE